MIESFIKAQKHNILWATRQVNMFYRLKRIIWTIMVSMMFRQVFFPAFIRCNMHHSKENASFLGLILRYHKVNMV